jgi:hypothetical protein
MVAVISLYAVPFVLTLAVTGVVRLSAGAERAAKFASVALPLGFLMGWAIVVAPGWHAYDAVGRIGHMVLGAAVVGLALDVWQPRRALAVPVLLLFIVGSAWAEANGGLLPRARPDGTVLAGFLAMIAAGCGLGWRLWRLSVTAVPVGTPSAAILVLLVMLALALAAVAAASGQDTLRATGLVLALALAAYLTWTWMTALPVPGAALVSAAAGLLAFAWALAERSAATLPGIALAALILFADGTARRIPLPRAGISSVIYPLVLAGIALLPLLLAWALTLTLHQGG